MSFRTYCPHACQVHCFLTHMLLTCSGRYWYKTAARSGHLNKYCSTLCSMADAQAWMSLSSSRLGKTLRVHAAFACALLYIWEAVWERWCPRTCIYKLICSSQIATSITDRRSKRMFQAAAARVLMPSYPHLAISSGWRGGHSALELPLTNAVNAMNHATTTGEGGCSWLAKTNAKILCRSRVRQSQLYCVGHCCASSKTHCRISLPWPPIRRSLLHSSNTYAGLCMYVCMYVCLMSWGPTEGQQTKFCLCKFMQSKHCSLGKNSS